MWNNIKDSLPKLEGQYMIWVKDEETGKEWKLAGEYWFDGLWRQANNRLIISENSTLCHVIAWYDMPDYHQ